MAKKIDWTNEEEHLVVVKTEAEKAEAFRLRKLEASKRMIARKKEAIARLVALALEKGDEDEKAAARYLAGDARIVKSGPTNQVLELIRTKGSVHEFELFKDYKMGRTEMRRFMKKYPEVKFDKDFCNYRIEVQA